MAIIKGLLKRKTKYVDGIYPYTQTDCVFNETGKGLDAIINDLNALINSKQNTLTAGNGISISNNTVSNTFQTLIKDTAIASGDKLVIKDASANNNIANSTLTFGTSTTSYLANNGTWQSPTVDTALSSTSTNPLQNKVINGALNGKANSSHVHGNITNGGDITTNVAIASGDRLVINDESASKITNSSIMFGTNQNQYLANNGTWQNTMTLLYSANNDASEFSDTTIPLTNLSSYSIIILVYKYENITNSVLGSIVMPYYTELSYRVLLQLSSSSTRYIRSFKLSNDGITTSQGSSTNYVIPYRIYGIK